MLKRSKNTGFGLFVDSDFRGLGVAQSLLDYSNEYIKQESFKRIDITVISENISAINLYLKNGFVKEGLKSKSIYINDNKYYDEIILAKIMQ